MGRIVIPGLVLGNEWIPPLRFEDSKVSTLTRILLDNKDTLFPDHFLVDFGLLLGKADEDQVVAGLALVEKHCKSWCLLYVSPSGSTVLSEIEHKIETTRTNEFGAREAMVLKQRIEDFTKEQLTSLVTYEDPKLIVVTDDPHHKWSEKLPDLNVEVMVVEAFLREQGDAIRINGMYPLIQNQNIIAFASPHAILPNTLELDRPLPSAFDALAQITLVCGDNESQWKTIGTQGEVRLLSCERYKLPNSRTFKITQEPGGSLSILPFKEK